MLYLWLKFIHVISSTILFGTGIGTACVMFYGHHLTEIKARAAINRYVVLADWIFTAPSAVIQLVTGLLMVYVAGYSFSALWIWGSLLGYIIAAACWLPVVSLQIQMRNMTNFAENSGSALPAAYQRYYNYWFALGWPAFISLLIVFYMMTNKPM